MADSILFSDFNDAMLNATINTQKWLIYDISPTWHPAIINIKAVELI